MGRINVSQNPGVQSELATCQYQSPMSSDGSILEIYGEEKHPSSDVEKQPDVVVESSAASSESSKDDLSSMSLKEVADMEEKLASDEAPDEAYRVQEAYEVALKVCFNCTDMHCVPSYLNRS